MSEYRASLLYFQPRRFATDSNGEVIPSGELFRLGETLITAFVRTSAPFEADGGMRFEGEILFMSQTELESPFSPGQKFEMVVPTRGMMKVIGECTILEKLA